MSIRVTAEDTENGDTATREITDDVVVITAGNHYIDGIVKYANGTQVITVKVDRS
jgi:hypothetical protein